MSVTAIKVLVGPSRSKTNAATVRKSMKDVPNSNGVRRPTRGIQIKEDTYATLRVVAGSGPRALVDAGGSTTSGSRNMSSVYSNFLLQSAQEERQEKQQTLETFGEAYIFLFGQHPRVMNFAGILVNTEDFNWEAEWWYNYDNYLRGTKCIQNDAQVFMTFDDTIVGGYILSSNSNKNSVDRNFVNFQFQLFVTYQTNITPVGDPHPVQDRSELTPVTQSAIAARIAINRPHIIDNQAFSRFTVGDDGKIQYGSLNDALASVSPSAFAKGWRTVQDTVRTVLTAINGIWSGAPVRVPSGFEGGFAYDEIDLQKDKTPAYGGPVKFSTYADNVDEYVGTSAQYDSSSLYQRFLPASGFQDASIELNDMEAVYSKSASELDKAGFVGHTEILDKIAKGVQLARIGLSIVVGVAGVASYKNKATVPDFTKSSLFGGTMPHINDNPYKE